MSRYNSECVVLRSIDYRDSDKIFTLLSKNSGKITAAARGVRKISSRRGGNLDTLNHVIIHTSESPSGYKNISEVRLINSFQKIKMSLFKSKMAYYCIELVYRFVQEGKDHHQAPIFDALTSLLTRLDKAGSNISASIIVNAFEIKLMSILGYEITLDKCAVSGTPFGLEWEGYRFSNLKGGLVLSTHDILGKPISKETAYALNYINSYNRGIAEKPKMAFTKTAIESADKIIKAFVTEVLETSIKTVRIYSAV